MVALVLSAVLALVSHTGQARGQLPAHGTVVPGVSFAGLKLGDTEQQVQRMWGRSYETCKYCTDTTWLYEYQMGEPLGAAVRFERNRAVAIFSLGSPAGWKTTKGLYIGDPVSNVYSRYTATGTTRCIGFDAITVRTGGTITAYYSAAGVIYGFAMVVPSMTVCQ
jgi:hypothetical protein